MNKTDYKRQKEDKELHDSYGLRRLNSTQFVRCLCKKCR